MLAVALQVLPVLFLASATLQVEAIEDNRFKISTVVNNPDSVEEHFNAQVGIVKKAQQVCKALKRGKAVSEGELFVDNLPPLEGKKRARLQVSEYYSCRQKQPPETPNHVQN